MTGASGAALSLRPRLCTRAHAHNVSWNQGQGGQSPPALTVPRPSGHGQAHCAILLTDF